MTPVDTLGEPVTVVDTLGEPVVLINNDGTPAFLAYSAKTYLGGVAPYHWLDFINNRALYAGADVGNVTQATGYSFTRASDGYYTNSDGTLTLFGSGALRRGDRGVLIEGSRTNLLLRSQEFNNASWQDGSPNIPTVAANSTAAPDGTTTADTLTAATGGTGSVSRQAVTTVGSTAYNFSIFIKQGTSASSRLLVRDATNGVNILQTTALTWSAGVPSIGSTTGTWATPVQLANGWWRVSGTASTGAGGVSCLVSIFPDNVAGTGSLIVWGAQLE
jgi:hypothetical protein